MSNGLWSGIEPAARGGIDVGDYHQRIENIVTKQRASILLQVYGEDAEYVVGYFVDLRGMRVGNEPTRVAKREIILRIVQEATPHPDSISFKGGA